MRDLHFKYREQTSMKECSSQIKESTIHHILTQKTPQETAERLNRMSKQRMTPNKIQILLAIKRDPAFFSAFPASTWVADRMSLW